MSEEACTVTQWGGGTATLLFPCETERLDALRVGRRGIGGCVLEDAECWPKCSVRSRCAAGPVAQG